MVEGSHWTCVLTSHPQRVGIENHQDENVTPETACGNFRKMQTSQSSSRLTPVMAYETSNIDLEWAPERSYPDTQTKAFVLVR
jgi:hypothetical protein